MVLLGQRRDGPRPSKGDNNEEGKTIEGILIYKWNHKALRHYIQTREGNGATTAATRRAGNGGDPRHDYRDATTTKTQEQEKQEKEENNED